MAAPALSIWTAAEGDPISHRPQVASLPRTAAEPPPNVGRTPPSAPDPLVRLFTCSSRPARGSFPEGTPGPRRPPQEIVAGCKGSTVL